MHKEQKNAPLLRVCGSNSDNSCRIQAYYKAGVLGIITNKDRSREERTAIYPVVEQARISLI